VSELRRQLVPRCSAADDRADAPSIEQVDQVRVDPLAVGAGEQVEARRALRHGRVAAVREHHTAQVEVPEDDRSRDDPDVFGLYEGVPLPERGDWAGAIPDRIRIFRLPLVESFPDPAQLEAEIRITVLHEVAHYFGIDEDRLDDLGFS